jgi:ribosomal protein S18 acetylase RimI-like enzyme
MSPEESPKLEVRPPRTEAEWRAAAALLHQLRPDVPESTMLVRMREISGVNGYRLLVGVSEDGVVLAAAGGRPDDGLSRGPHLRIDDLVVAEGRRGAGLGRAMLAGLAEEAREQGLPRILLDARHDARGFYERLGFVFRGAEPCMIDIGDA